MTDRKPQNANLATVNIVKQAKITSELWVIWIEKPKGFSFKPGQYCTIGRDNVERAYSISSAPHEHLLEIFVELIPMPEGRLTPKLWELKVGDKVTIRPKAKGLFTFNSGYRRHLMIGTVTGTVPFVSMIRDYMHRGSFEHHFYVLEGASYYDELTYDKELNNYHQEHPDIVTYVPTISRPKEIRNKQWQGEAGRVNLILKRYIDKFNLNPTDTLVYACGHPGMIEDVKTQLIPEGFCVEEERFWKDN